MTPIVIIGAGPAGLAAAEAASRGGQAVLLIDENPAPGGQIWRGGAPHWNDLRAQRLWEAVRGRPSVQLALGTRVVASAGAGMLLLERDGVPALQSWQRMIICSGARELLLPFPGWTLPGVTGAGGMQALIKNGMPVAGKRVLVAGTGPLLLAVAATVRRHGGIVAGIAEHRSMPELARFGARLAAAHPAKLGQALRLGAGLLGVPYLSGTNVVAASGGEQLESVRLRQGGSERTTDCDFLACGFGLVPAPESAALFGCALAGGKVVVDGAQATSVAGVWAAGELTGIGGVDKSLAEGRIAGLAAVGLAPGTSEARARRRALAFAALLGEHFAAPLPMRTACEPSTIVCRCEDVRAAALQPHASWRAAKLQTRVGMGPCQGRVCGAACQFLYGWRDAGTRPPLMPASAASLALVPPRRQ